MKNKEDQKKQRAKDKPDPAITVSGVTFSAKDVKSAVVTIDGRDVQIGERTQAERKIGFIS